MIEMTPFPLRGDRPAWSTAVGLGPIPYRFAGSNPAPRTMFYFQEVDSAAWAFASRFLRF